MMKPSSVKKPPMTSNISKPESKPISNQTIKNEPLNKISA